jgi:beta-glucosidase
LVPYYTTSPFDGFSKKLASEHLCQYAVGAYAHKELPFFGREVRTPDGRPGVLFSLYTEPPEVATRKAVDVLNPTNTNMFLLGFRHPKLTDPLWWAAVEFNLKPDSDVEYDFGLSVYGTGKLFVNDELVVDNATTQKPGGSFFGLGTAEIIGSKLLRGGQEYSIRVEYASAPTSKLLAGGKVQFPGGGIRIGGAPKIDARQEIIKAVEIAKTAEKVVLCIGLNVSSPYILFTQKTQRYFGNRSKELTSLV